MLERKRRFNRRFFSFVGCCFTIAERWENVCATEFAAIFFSKGLVLDIAISLVLFALAFVLTPLMLAFVFKREKIPEDSRYFAYLLPIGFLATGMLWDGVLRAIWRWAPREGWWNQMR